MKAILGLAISVTTLFASAEALAVNKCAGFSIDGNNWITFTNTCSQSIMVTLHDQGACDGIGCSFGPIKPGGQQRWGAIVGRISVDDVPWPTDGSSTGTRNSGSVSNSVSDGMLNMRSGPGQGHGVVVPIPAGATGVSIGNCTAADDGKSRYQWCQVEWNGYRGWVSMGGLIVDQSAQETEPEQPATESAPDSGAKCICFRYNPESGYDRMLHKSCLDPTPGAPESRMGQGNTMWYNEQRFAQKVRDYDPIRDKSYCDP